MALSAFGRWQVTVTLASLDNNEVPQYRQKTLEVAAEGATAGDQYLDVLDAIDDFVTKHNAVSDSKIVEVFVTRKLVESPYPTLVDADLYHEATVTVFTNTFNKKALVSIPAPKDSLMNSNGFPDRDNADLNINLGLYITPNDFLLSDGENIRTTNYIDKLGYRHIGRKNVTAG